MDQTSRSAHQNRPKQTKSNMMKKKKQQEVKVVHFSNPIMVTTTAAGFRALVQELTGRDSHIADFLAANSAAAVSASAGDTVCSLDQMDADGPGRAGIFDLPPPEFKCELAGYGDGDSFDTYDERFGSVEDYGEIMNESVMFEAPLLAGDGVCGWVL